MEPEMLAGMIFTLLIIAMVLGFIILFPLTKRLGLFLEQKLGEKSVRNPPHSADELLRTREQVQALESEVRKLAERQQFVEELVTRRDPAALSAGVNQAD